MELWQAVILGIVQGATEFLPISSSGHLALAPWLFGWEDPGLTYDVALHIGTLLVLIGYFWRDWVRYIKAGIGSVLKRSLAETDAKVAWLIALGCAPAALIGFMADDWIEANTRNPLFIAINIMIFGLVLYWADQRGAKAREVEQLTLKDSITVGLAQALALVPGVSRSGITMTAGLFSGLTRQSAARFSFLLSAPITLGAVVFKLKDVEFSALPTSEQQAFVVGIMASAAAGLVAVSWMLKYIQQKPFTIFMWYRLGFGALIILVYFWRG